MSTGSVKGPSAYVSGGADEALLLAGEIPGAPVIGELVPRGEYPLVVR